jgi:S1-C subfamily serine protease
MFRRVVTLFALALALGPVASAQQPQGAVLSDGKARWVVSVVHRVDLHKLINRWREQQKARVGVPGSAPDTIFNVATGLAVDSQGHVVTRLAYVDPEDSDQKVSVVTSDGVSLPARLIGVDCATGFSVLEVDSLKPSLPEFVEQSGVPDGLRVKILSADYIPRPASNDKANEIYISPSIRITQGQVGTGSIYSRARGALTLRSTGLLSRNDSSIVTTDSNQVIGMAQYAGFGRAYLFPIEFIRDTVAKRVIEKKGSVPAGWLGVYGDSLARVPDTERGAIGIDSKMGVIVREFPPNSPAFTSGVLPNDVIIGIDGFDVAGSTDLSAILSSMPAGHKVQLRVVRNRQNLDISVELGARAYTPPAINLGDVMGQKGSSLSHREEVQGRLTELASQYKSITARKDITPRERNEALRELEIEIRQLQDRLRELEQRGAGQEPIKADNKTEPDNSFKAGFVLREITPQLAGYFGAKAGMLIVTVVKDSPAERGGLKTGDVIVGLNDKETSTMAQLREALSTQKGDLRLKVVRAKAPMVITIENR